MAEGLGSVEGAGKPVEENRSHKAGKRPQARVDRRDRRTPLDFLPRLATVQCAPEIPSSLVIQLHILLAWTRSRLA